MGRYVLKRLLWLVIIMVSVAILIFSVMYFIPGDPADIMLPDATYEEKQIYRDTLGLNDPYIMQLGRFLYDTFIRFDLGISYSLKKPVLDEFMIRLPRTVALSWICIIIDALIGIPLGISAALHRNSIQDRSLMVFSMVGVSIPGFWLALLLVMLFSQRLGWLPAYGIGTWKHWVMPVIAGAVGGLATNARQTRSAVLETIRADFVTTARAKGVAEKSVIYKHLLPNAMIPIVNGLGSRLAMSLGGTVVIETVFTFPGVGTYLMNGITGRDYPVVRACILVLALFAAVVMLLVDLFYAYMDPRIKAQYQRLGAGKGGLK